MLVALETLGEELVDAPDELELYLHFEADDYEEEKLRDQVTTWLFEAHWPWVVVGVDRQGTTCCFMLAVGSMHEVMYGV